MNSLKRSFVFLFATLFVLSCVSAAMAQVVTPRPSQKASVMQTIGSATRFSIIIDVPLFALIGITRSNQHSMRRSLL